VFARTARTVAASVSVSAGTTGFVCRRAVAAAFAWQDTLSAHWRMVVSVLATTATACVTERSIIVCRAALRVSACVKPCACAHVDFDVYEGRQIAARAHAKTSSVMVADTCNVMSFVWRQRIASDELCQVTMTLQQ
jgi:hypothetical protein